MLKCINNHYRHIILFQGKRVTFIDKVRIYVKGGTGGMGFPSAGGCGGQGGDVYVQCKDGGSLAMFKTLGNRRQIAEHGTHYKYMTSFICIFC